GRVSFPTWEGEAKNIQPQEDLDCFGGYEFDLDHQPRDWLVYPVVVVISRGALAKRASVEIHLATKRVQPLVVQGHRPWEALVIDDGEDPAIVDQQIDPAGDDLKVLRRVNRPLPHSGGAAVAL